MDLYIKERHLSRELDYNFIKIIENLFSVEESSYQLDTRNATDLVSKCKKEPTYSTRARDETRKERDFTSTVIKGYGGKPEFLKIIDNGPDYFIHGWGPKGGQEIREYMITDLSKLRLLLKNDIEEVLTWEGVEIQTKRDNAKDQFICIPFLTLYHKKLICDFDLKDYNYLKSPKNTLDNIIQKNNPDKNISKQDIEKLVAHYTFLEQKISHLEQIINSSKRNLN
jgi:hypothetical protein